MRCCCLHDHSAAAAFMSVNIRVNVADGSYIVFISKSVVLVAKDSLDLDWKLDVLQYSTDGSWEFFRFSGLCSVMFLLNRQLNHRAL